MHASHTSTEDVLHHQISPYQLLMMELLVRSTLMSIEIPSNRDSHWRVDVCRFHFLPRRQSKRTLQSIDLILSRFRWASEWEGSSPTCNRRTFSSSSKRSFSRVSRRILKWLISFKNCEESRMACCCSWERRREEKRSLHSCSPVIIHRQRFSGEYQVLIRYSHSSTNDSLRLTFSVFDNMPAPGVDRERPACCWLWSILVVARSGRLPHANVFRARLISNEMNECDENDQTLTMMKAWKVYACTSQASTCSLYLSPSPPPPFFLLLRSLSLFLSNTIFVFFFAFLFLSHSSVCPSDVYECSVFDDHEDNDDKHCYSDYYIHWAFSLRHLYIDILGRWASTDVYESPNEHMPIWLFFFFELPEIYIDACIHSEPQKEIDRGNITITESNELDVCCTYVTKKSCLSLARTESGRWETRFRFRLMLQFFVFMNCITLKFQLIG